MTLKLNQQSMIDISTGHLSVFTRDFIDALDSNFPISIARRAEGYVVASIHGVEDESYESLPGDLAHCLRFANVNGIDYVMFDSNADQQTGLPYYGDRNSIDDSIDYIGAGTALDTDYKLQHVKRELITDGDLQITSTPQLADGDYNAPDGLWVGIDNASVRINSDADAVHVTVMPRGYEMDDSLAAHLGVLHTDLQDAIAENVVAELGESPSGP